VVGVVGKASGGVDGTVAAVDAVGDIRREMESCLGEGDEEGD